MKRSLLFGMIIAFLLAPLAGAAQATFDCAGVIEIPQPECQALVALYNSTDGPNWADSTNWLATETPGGWYGVTVESGHVTRLVLPFNLLDGTLPPELGDLSLLQNLQLQNNSLVGSIPAELGALSALDTLELSNNQLAGSIPPELADLSSLIYIYLSDNQLSGAIPPGLGSLSHLQRLDLSLNKLSGAIPGELGGLSKLMWLDLDYNQLGGPIPAQLGQLGSLVSLQLDHNRLSGSIPAELGSLQQLHDLWLDHNQLSGAIPPALAGADSLTFLDLSHNQLYGAIPGELGTLSVLGNLLLNDNQLSGPIPGELGNLGNLVMLSLAGNQLSGAIPAELGGLGQVSILRLERNLLSGAIPASLANLDTLVDAGQAWDGGDGLDLDYNLLDVPAGYPDPSDPLQAFLAQKDPDWHTLQGFQQLIGSAGGMLVALDGRAAFDIPAGALLTDTTFTFMPLPTLPHSPARLADGHNSFVLNAEDDAGQPVFSFALPVTVTLSYVQEDIPSLFEDTLRLYAWEAGWQDALESCEGGEYRRDLAADSFWLPVCRLGEFAVLGETLQFFIPLVER